MGVKKAGISIHAHQNYFCQYQHTGVITMGGQDKVQLSSNACLHHCSDQTKAVPHEALMLQVTMPKRSQSSQDMLQPAQKPLSSLPSTPEKPSDFPPHPQIQPGPPAQSQPLEGKKKMGSGEKGKDGAVGTAKGGGAGWGIMGRVASGLLGSGIKKSVDKKGVSLSCLPIYCILTASVCVLLLIKCKHARHSSLKRCLGSLVLHVWIMYRVLQPLQLLIKLDLKGAKPFSKYHCGVDTLRKQVLVLVSIEAQSVEQIELEQTLTYVEMGDVELPIAAKLDLNLHMKYNLHCLTDV